MFSSGNVHKRVFSNVLRGEEVGVIYMESEDIDAVGDDEMDLVTDGTGVVEEEKVRETAAQEELDGVRMIM